MMCATDVLYHLRAGFGYDFNTLNPEGKPNELSLAFSRLFMSSPSISSLVPFLRTLFPILKLIVSQQALTKTTSLMFDNASEPNA